MADPARVPVLAPRPAGGRGPFLHAILHAIARTEAEAFAALEQMGASPVAEVGPLAAHPGGSASASAAGARCGAAPRSAPLAAGPLRTRLTPRAAARPPPPYRCPYPCPYCTLPLLTAANAPARGNAAPLLL